jgi:hypothetical protein
MDSVKITDTISMTYAQFYNTITNNNLQVGKTYILVDFQTVYDQMDFDSRRFVKTYIGYQNRSNGADLGVML